MRERRRVRFRWKQNFGLVIVGLVLGSASAAAPLKDGAPAAVISPLVKKKIVKKEINRRSKRLLYHSCVNPSDN